MALRQPREFRCGIESVRWVYRHTVPGARMREYIVAIFCQRGPPVTAETFCAENEKLGILADAMKFMRMLNRVRVGNPQGSDGYDLLERVPTMFWGENWEWSGRILAMLVTGGEEVGWSRIRYSLPSFLSWGDNWEDLPDEQFFVHKADIAVEGWELLAQLRKM
jgi:hypothetical protein